MIVQFNTDHNINGTEKLITPFVEMITDELRRYSEHITRIEAHLTDEDGRKQGEGDKRCVLEARIEGKQPVAVTSHADNYRQAVESAIDKLLAMLDTQFGKLNNHH